MKKIIPVVLTAMLLSGCASCEREFKTLGSDFAGGMDRTIRVYTPTGELIAEYSGFVDVQISESGRLLFDMNGRRYIYQNAIIEVIENTKEEE